MKINKKKIEAIKEIKLPKSITKGVKPISLTFSDYKAKIKKPKISEVNLRS